MSAFPSVSYLALFGEVKGKLSQAMFLPSLFKTDRKRLLIKPHETCWVGWEYSESL